jgi:uncharacterized phage protein gp47/JayE
MITIPTIAQLRTAILADLSAQYGSGIPTFGKNFLRAIAYAQAARLKLYYLAIASLQKNIFIDTADPEALGGTLERFGRIKLNRNPFPAQAAQYEIQVTGSIGATIAASTTFKSDDDSANPGVLYVLDNTYVLVSTTDSIVVRALTPGLDGQLSIADTLTATAPIAGVNSAAAVLMEEVEPLAAEDLEAYRTKGIEAYRLEPQGGAPGDYRLWALDAQGVQQTYPYAKSGVTGEVNLFVEATIADSTDSKGTPSAGLLSDVEDVVEFDPDTTKPIDERGRRPLGAFMVHYLPVTPLDIDISITGFVGLTTDIQDAILSALTDSLTSVRPFIAGADVLTNKNDIFSVNSIISIVLQAVPGAQFTSVTMTVDGSPETTYTFDQGFIPYLNSITYP